MPMNYVCLLPENMTKFQCVALKGFEKVKLDFREISRCSFRNDAI